MSDAAYGELGDVHGMQAVAQQAEGYDGADLRVLAGRALHAAARRQLTSASGAARPSPGLLMVSSQDLTGAQTGFQPAAAWGVGHLQVLCTASLLPVLLLAQLLPRIQATWNPQICSPGTHSMVLQQ